MLPRPFTIPVGFSVVIEYAIINSWGVGHNAGFWLGYPSKDGCSLSPSDAVLFIRITNTGPSSTMITAYNVETGRGTRKEGGQAAVWS